MGDDGLPVIINIYLAICLPVLEFGGVFWGEFVCLCVWLTEILSTIRHLNSTGGKLLDEGQFSVTDLLEYLLR